MGWALLLRQLWRRRHAVGSGARTAFLVRGARVRLRNPLASSHTVWIPAGASGIVVGWDTRGRRVSVELDTPRTVVTVPWAWVAEEPTQPPAAAPPGPPPAGP